MEEQKKFIAPAIDETGLPNPPAEEVEEKAEETLTDKLELLEEDLREHGSIKTPRELMREEAKEYKTTQIEMLSKVLQEEFGGPIQDESPCEMAIRLLREQKDALDNIRYGGGNDS